MNKNYARLDREDLILTPNTNKSRRVVTIPKFLCDIVDDYVATLYDYLPLERLFPIARNTLNGHLRRISEKAAVKKIRVHDLRHSHASLLIEEGFTALLISERLGHESIQTTLQTYAHLCPNKHGEVADRLDKLHGSIPTSEMKI
ncbi:MAG: site-specific integrase [Clostridiales bacterium]|nr:site-specific integrase [Clostridiales bacterium]